MRTYPSNNNNSNTEGLGYEVVSTSLGNDSTDATAGIQAKLDAVKAAGGGTVYLPKGNFRHSGLIIDADNVSLIGEGFNSVLRHTGTTGDGITISDPENGGTTVQNGVFTGHRDNVSIKNLKLAPVNPKTAGYEIRADKAYRVQIDNVELNNVYGGISMGKPSGVNSAWHTVQNIFAYNWRVLLNMVNTIDGEFKNWKTYADTHLDDIAILMDGGCEGNEFSFIGPVNAAPNSHLNHSAPNLRIQKVAFTEKASAFNNFNHCYFDTHNTGAEILEANDITFASCWFSARPGNGLYIGSGSNNIKVTAGCRFMGSGKDAIYIAGGKDHVIESASIICSNNGNTGNYGGIYVSDSAENTKLLNNNILNRGWSRLPGFEVYGIRLHPNADNYHIQGNTIAGITDKIVRWDGGAGAKTVITTENTATKQVKDNFGVVVAT